MRTNPSAGHGMVSDLMPPAISPGTLQMPILRADIEGLARHVSGLMWLGW